MPRGHVYMVGICGAGMTSLAGLLTDYGFHVTGSDSSCFPPASEILSKVPQVKVLKGYDPSNIPEHVSFAVVGNVVSANNPEVAELQRRKVPLYTMPYTMNRFFLKNRFSIVVAGTHGKTTTTTLIAWLMHKAGEDALFFAGGISKNFGRSYWMGSGSTAVVEGDEYPTSFFDPSPKMLKYSCGLGIITSMEMDHIDVYPSFDEYKQVFYSFARKSPHLVVCLDDPNLEHMVKHHGIAFSMSYGLKKGDVKVERILSRKKWTYFEVSYRGKKLGRFRIQVPGIHNVKNALAAISTGVLMDIKVKFIKDALETFKGVRRRQEILWENDFALVDDFAHHPTAVRETILAVKRRFPGKRIWAIFEPRSYTSRTSYMEDELAESLAHAECVLITYPQRGVREAHQVINPERVVRKIKNKVELAKAFKRHGSIVRLLRTHLRHGDVILLMSSGNLGGIAGRIKDLLESYHAGSSSKGA